MSTMEITFVLGGAHEGKDFNFQGYNFTKGELVLRGSVQDVEAHRQYLKANLNVKVKGEVELPEPPSTEGNEGGGADTAAERLVEAIKKLDHANDDHWTQAGKPAIAAVEKLYGSNELTRASIEAAVPGWDRETAKKAAESNA